MYKVDKNSDQWTTFLKGIGLTVGLETVREIATRVVFERPLYPLYAHREGIPPVDGKGTVYKVKGLIEDRRLDPLLHYWELKKPEEKYPEQHAHLRALKTFLQEDTNFRNSFSAETPGSHMEGFLKQLVQSRREGERRALGLRRAFSWEAFPIVSKIRDHCPGHQLWGDVEEWKRKRNEYRRTAFKVARRLIEEFEGELQFPATEITSTELEVHLLLDIFNWSTGQLLGKVPHNGHVLSRPGEEMQGQELIFRLVFGGSCYAEGTQEQIEQATDVIKDMRELWSDSDDIRSLVHQYHSLEALSQKINDEIQQIDEAVLGQGSCRNCHNLRAEQS